MSKELEALERLYCVGSLEQHKKDYEFLKITLHRLEAIDNATPSEALECLERIEADLVGLPKHVTEYDDIFDDYLDDIEDNIDTIKQALLKQQEKKTYLKWEDLEFKKEIQEMKVLLNGETYVLDYKFYTCEHNVIHLSTLEYDRVLTCCGDYDFDIQFFNDLHLERVEE